MCYKANWDSILLELLYEYYVHAAEEKRKLNPNSKVVNVFAQAASQVVGAFLETALEAGSVHDVMRGPAVYSQPYVCRTLYTQHKAS
jgi:hypothetical protein